MRRGQRREQQGRGRAGEAEEPVREDRGRAPLRVEVPQAQGQRAVDEAEPREQPRSGLVAAEGGLVRTLADLGNPRRLASPELAYERIG